MQHPALIPASYSILVANTPFLGKVDGEGGSQAVA